MSYKMVSEALPKLFYKLLLDIEDPLRLYPSG